MNDYSFRFVTRTRYRDYKVYIHGGLETISNREGFRPLRQKCGITEGEQCVCIFQENLKIYLVVSALDRHKTDERGRAIRFSFCQIFTNKQQAASAFIKAADHWEDVEAWLSKNLHDINEGSETEGVELNESAFTKWLVNDGEEFDSEHWLKKGKVLKWTKRDGKEDYLPIGEIFDPINADYADNFSDSNSKKKIIAGVAAATVIAGLSIGGYYIMGSKKDVQNIEKVYDENNVFDPKKLSINIQTELQQQEHNFTSRDSRELECIVSEAFDKLKSSDATQISKIENVNEFAEKVIAGINEMFVYYDKSLLTPEERLAIKKVILKYFNLN